MLTFDPNEKVAVVVIDMQYDFVEPDGILAAEGSKGIVNNILGGSIPENKRHSGQRISSNRIADNRQ